MNNFQKLIETMEKLRSENGCPWDREQTRDTLKKYLLEETYEVLEAIDRNDPEDIKEELGDLLFQIVFQCQIAKEQGEFSIDDTIRKIIVKMVGRHPHVFGEEQFETSEEVLKQWEERKKEEGKNRESILDGIPRELPALLRAHRMQARAARAGFDWQQIDDVVAKLQEEVEEFKRALEKKDVEGVEDEVGDILFCIVNISRFVRVTPEDALRKTIAKFTMRFQHMEKRALEMGKNLSEMTLQEMDTLWEEAKMLS